MIMNLFIKKYYHTYCIELNNQFSRVLTSLPSNVYMVLSQINCRIGGENMMHFLLNALRATLMDSLRFTFAVATYPSPGTCAFWNICKSPSP